MFRSQFQPVEWIDVSKNLLYFEPCKGFTGEHVESLSMLIKRMQGGVPVNMLPDGIDEEDQIFDSECVDKFEYLDKVAQLKQSNSVKGNRDRRAVDAAYSGAASPGEPSLKPGEDSAGNNAASQQTPENVLPDASGRNPEASAS